jgi:pentatricopeptide repeat protein
MAFLSPLAMPRRHDEAQCLHRITSFACAPKPDLRETTTQAPKRPRYTPYSRSKHFLDKRTAKNTSTPRVSGPKVHSDRIVRLARIGDLQALDVAVAAALADGFVMLAPNWTTIANAKAVKGDLDGAKRALDGMREAHVPPTNATFRVAIKAARSQSDIWAAVEWFRDCACEAAERKSYNMALSALTKMEAIDGNRARDDDCGDAVSRVFALMLSAGSRDGGTVARADCYSFNTVLHCWRQRRRLTQGNLREHSLRHSSGLLTSCEIIRQAFGVFGKMRLHPLTVPDICTYNTILALCVEAVGNEKNGDESGGAGRNAAHRQASLRLLSFLRAMPSSMEWYGVEADNVTFTLLLKAITCQHKQMVPVAEYEGERGEGNGTAQATSSSLRPLNAYSSNASRLIRKLWRSVPWRLDIRSYNTIIASFAKVGDVQMAVFAFQQMTQRDVISADRYTYNALLSAAGSSGDLALARRIIANLKDHRRLNPDAFSFSAALVACGENVTASIELLDEAIQCGVVCTAPMLNAALKTHGADLNAALTRWQSWRKSAQYSNAARDIQVYRALLRAAGVAGRPESALRIIFAGKKASEIDPTVDVGLFGSFVRGMREGGQLKRVRHNIFANTYLKHLRLECRAFGRLSSLPVERIVVRW